MEVPQSPDKPSVRERAKAGDLIFLQNFPRSIRREPDGQLPVAPPDRYQAGSNKPLLDTLREEYGQENVVLGPPVPDVTAGQKTEDTSGMLGVYVTAEAHKTTPSKES